MKTANGAAAGGGKSAPQTKKSKKQITINIDTDIIEYFKSQAEASGIPYQNLINLYLSDCVRNNRSMQIVWR